MKRELIFAILLMVGVTAPNMSILYADGDGDLGANHPESKVITPNPDQMVAEGVHPTDGDRSSGIKKREIYLLIGQSNMAGRGPIESMDEGPIVGCELFNAEGKWEPATNPLNKYSTVGKKRSVQKLNPGYGFAKRMHELRPEISVGLVVNARGGTSISKWAKTSTEYNYYTEAVARTQAALADGNSRLAGILWHQGESDGNRTGSYMRKLTTLIADLRADFNAPDLPFIAGQVEMDDADGKPPRVFNEVIIQLPTVVSNTAVVSAEGLLTLDGTHFDSAGQRELGRRYADALLSLE